MMQFIAQLIEAALFELAEKGVIDWTPDDGAPDTFEAEAEIEYATDPHGISTVIMCGWYLFIWRYEGQLRAYHAFSMTSKPCKRCQASIPQNELKDGLCDYCEWKAWRIAQGLEVKS